MTKVLESQNPELKMNILPYLYLIVLHIHVHTKKTQI